MSDESERATEGRRRCGSCLQPVGTLYDGTYRAWRGWVDENGEHVFCQDAEACTHRWQGVKDAERFSASEARIYDPEPEDDDEP